MAGMIWQVFKTRNVLETKTTILIRKCAKDKNMSCLTCSAGNSSKQMKKRFVIQSQGRFRLFVTLWTVARQASLSFTISWSFLKFMSVESAMLSNPLILCHPLLLLPSFFPSIRVFSNESALQIRWPKYWIFSFSISIFPMNIQGWFHLGLTGLISLQSKGLSSIFSSTTIQKHRVFGVL